MSGFFAKAPILIPYNDNRLYGDSEMVTVEPFSFYPSIPFTSVGAWYIIFNRIKLGLVVHFSNKA